MHFRGFARLLGRTFVMGAVGLTVASCSDMQLLETGVCGNFVIDAGEDCDGHPLEDGTACAPPGSARACRQVCEAPMVCPTGWGCGGDGLCRQPSGKFEQYGGVIPFVSPNLMYSGDFDDDGATDILLLGHENTIGTRPMRIAFSRPGMVSAELRTLDLHVASPTIGEGDDDGGYPDLVFATPNGISLLRGTFDRSLDFSVFPYYTPPGGVGFRVIALDAFADRPGDELLVFTDQPNGKSAVSPLDNMDPAILLELPFSVADLAGDVQQGQFDEAAPCRQLLFAQRNASSVLVYPPCRNDGSSEWNLSAAPTVVTLPTGTTIQKDVLIADLDLDTHLDLLMGTNKMPYVAWGMGDGTFVSAKDAGIPNASSPYEMPSGSNDDYPLAVAELNMDGQIDFVLPRGLLMSRNPGYEFIYQNIGAPWSSVVVEDLNTNGLKDVMVCSDESVDCTFLNNAGGGIFNPAVVPTEAPVAKLSSADFDGDLIRDVAALENHMVNGSIVHNDLAVGFGRTHGPPDALAFVGSLENTTQLVPTIFRDPWEKVNVLDGIADLLAVDAHEIEVNGETKLETHAVLFRGSSSRVISTSRPLINGTASALPLATTIAQFANEVPEITVLGAERDTGKLRIWTIEGAAGDAAYPGPYLPTGFHSSVGADEISFRYAALMDTGDLDEDGTDEVVVVAPFGMAAGEAAVLIADYNDADDTFVPRMPSSISAAITVDDKFELLDVDHDGHLDGVFYTGSHEEPGDLIVLWGDGTGQLQTGAPIHVRPEGGATGFACLSNHHGCELVISSPNGVFLTIIGTGRNIELLRRSDLPGASSIATGDFNRDGVRDVALHTQQGLTYFRALTVNP